VVDVQEVAENGEVLSVETVLCSPPYDKEKMAAKYPLPEGCREMTTDAFCEWFQEHQDFHGPLARAVSNLNYPEGVDRKDPRVVQIKITCTMGGVAQQLTDLGHGPVVVVPPGPEGGH
jgi:hypothetical protein